MKCEVCGTEFDHDDLHNFGGADCPYCGAHYCHNEGVMLMLGPRVSADYLTGEVTFKIKMEPKGEEPEPTAEKDQQ